MVDHLFYYSALLDSRLWWNPWWWGHTNGIRPQGAMDIILQIINAFPPPLWCPRLIEWCRHLRYWLSHHGRRLAPHLQWHQQNCRIAWQFHQHIWWCCYLTPTLHQLRGGAQSFRQMVNRHWTNKRVCPTTHWDQLDAEQGGRERRLANQTFKSLG